MTKNQGIEPGPGVNQSTVVLMKKKKKMMMMMMVMIMVEGIFFMYDLFAENQKYFEIEKHLMTTIMMITTMKILTKMIQMIRKQPVAKPTTKVMTATIAT